MTVLEHEFQRLFNAQNYLGVIDSVLQKFYQSESIDVSTTERIFSEIFENFEVTSFSTTLQYFVSILFMVDLKDSTMKKIVMNAYKQLLLSKSSRRSFFIHAMFYLIENILQVSTTHFSLDHWNLYSREISAEKTILLGCSWVLLGKMKKNISFIQQGISLLESQKWLLDHLNQPFLSFGEKEHNYDKEKNLLAFALLFYVSSKIQGQDLSDFHKCMKKIHKISNPLVFVLLKGIDQFSFDEKVSTSLKQSKWAKFSKGQMSGLVSFDGLASPLAFFKFQQIEIPAMGPQSLPLHETKDFGIASTSGYYKYDGKNHVLGWLQWNFDRSWWLLDINMKSDCIYLQMRNKNEKLQNPFAFVFFVQAKECHIQQEVTLLPGSLEHYSGTSHKVEFEKENEKITIQSIKDIPMQVIPLAGEGCFWGGDFMLAYEIHRSMISFEIHHNLFFNS